MLPSGPAEESGVVGRFIPTDAFAFIRWLRLPHEGKQRDALLPFLILSPQWVCPLPPKMAKTKAKISGKALDVLKSTKKAGPASGQPTTKSVKARSRSRSRTPGRPSTAITPSASSPPAATSTPITPTAKRGRGRPAKTPVKARTPSRTPAKRTPAKKKTPKSAKKSGKKSTAKKATKRVGKTPTSEAKPRPQRRSVSRSRAAKPTDTSPKRTTPKSTRKTPTRSSGRQSNAYALRGKVVIDDSPAKARGSQSSLSSKSSTGGGWFSKCSIV